MKNAEAQRRREAGGNALLKRLAQQVNIFFFTMAPSLRALCVFASLR